ncbi:MAG: lipopolysaccharide biosynthesis protein [Oceanospirillaceae bacterium]|nr:lipopolysaccharide biosynthesis protein [Oceanospirillaceae bacterium]
MIESSLRKRYLIKLLSSVINGLIGFLIIFLVPKAIGPVAYGQFTYIQQFCIKLYDFLDAGSSIAFYTKLSAKPNRKELISFYFYYSLCVFFIVGLFFYLMSHFNLADKFLPEIDSKYIIVGLIYGFLIWFSQIFIKISDAYALTVQVELIKIIHKFFSIIVLFYLVYCLDFDLKMYFEFHIVFLFLFIFVLFCVFYDLGIFSKKMIFLELSMVKSIFFDFFRYCSPLFLYIVAGLLSGFFDIWLLQRVGGAVEMGYYGLAYSVAAMCFVLTVAMTPIITREFSKSFEERDLAAMAELFKRYIPMLYSIAAYFSVFITFQSDNVLAIFTDKQFQEAYLVLVVMALYPIHQTYGQLSGSVFYATGQTKKYRNVGLFSMVVGLILTLFFVYIFELGAMGLALKMVITQLIAVNIQLFFNVKFLDLNMVDFIKHQVLAVALFCCAALLPSMFVDISSPIIEFLVSGVIYTLIVVLILFIFPSLFSVSRSELKDAIKKVIRRKK